MNNYSELASIVNAEAEAILNEERSRFLSQLRKVRNETLAFKKNIVRPSLIDENMSSVSNAKIPRPLLQKLALPTFSGNLDEWPNFKNMVTSLVLNKPEELSF